MEYNLIWVNEFYGYSCGDVTSDVNFEKPKEMPRNSRDRKESGGPEGTKRILCHIMKHERIPEQPGNGDYFYRG